MATRPSTLPSANDSPVPGKTATQRDCHLSGESIVWKSVRALRYVCAMAHFGDLPWRVQVDHVDLSVPCRDDQQLSSHVHAVRLVAQLQLGSWIRLPQIPILASARLLHLQHSCILTRSFLSHPAVTIIPPISSIYRTHLTGASCAATCVAAPCAPRSYILTALSHPDEKRCCPV